MPYLIMQHTDGPDAGKWCVHDKHPDGSPGASRGCSATEDMAKQHMAAMYANEPGKAAALKFADEGETQIEGLGMPWGGPHNGQDLAGEHFSVKTDFAFDWFPEGTRPLLYHHGLENGTELTPVGRVLAHEIKADVGVWVRAQLDASSQYFDAIRDLVRKGKLYFSSGAMAHLVETDKKTGEIKRWPWVEMSMTPTPCNLLAELGFAEQHFEAVGTKAAFETVKGQLAQSQAITDWLVRVQASSLTEHAGYTAQMAAALLERTKDLRERRVKEGRVLSTSNRKRLTDCLASMRTACDDLAVLLDSTDPAAAEAKAQTVRRLQVQFEALRLRTLAM